jgi:hypothetical protein
MNSQSPLLLLLLLAPLFLSAQQNASQQMVLHKYPSDHLAISTPANWVEIPKAELDQMSANIRAVAPNAKPQPYNYGFQISTGSKYPRVVIQVKTSGRWPEKTIAQLPRLSTMKDDIKRKMDAEMPGLAALNIQVGKLAYDPVRQIVWLRMQFTGDDGEIQGLSGIYPTNVGAIQVNCYSSAATLEQYAPLFSEIITSVQVDEEWKYRERSALGRAIGSLNDLSTSAGTGAVGGIAAVWVVRFLRKRKQVGQTANTSA